MTKHLNFGTGCLEFYENGVLVAEYDGIRLWKIKEVVSGVISAFG